MAAPATSQQASELLEDESLAEEVENLIYLFSTVLEWVHLHFCAMKL